MRYSGVGSLALIVAIVAPLAVADEDALRRRVETRARELAVESVDPPDRFEVTAARWSGPVPTTAGPLSLQLIDRTGPNHAGVVSVRLALIAGGERVGAARVGVRGRRLGPALVAGGTLRAGEPVADDRVRLEQSDLTRVVGAPLRDPAALSGRVPRRTIGAGRTLVADQFEAEPVVLRGSDVELIYRNNSLEVVTLGMALRDAAPGQQTEARNVRSGARVSGRAQEDGRILVSTARRAP